MKRIGIISGSQRKDPNTRKVAELVANLLATTQTGIESYSLFLNENPLPLWDDTMWTEGSALRKHWQPYSDKLKACDGFVILSPEWGGMVPAALKNFFLYVGNAEMGHKPGLIVTVSTGIGGCNPVHELRTSSFKNNRLCYIPDHVILRNVSDFLADFATEKSEITRALKTRLVYCLRLLRQYADALTHVRESGVVDYKSFPNGMS